MTERAKQKDAARLDAAHALRSTADRLENEAPIALTEACHEVESILERMCNDTAALSVVIGEGDRIGPALHRGAEPVDAFLLIPFGEIDVERPIAGRSFQFTPAHAASAERWFTQLGRKLAIDYEHQSIDRLNTRDDGLRPAAGWIGKLEIRDDGLWAAQVEWTDRARELIASGEYRYFSPVIYWADEDYSELSSLGPVALTNDPAIRGVAPLAATRKDDRATVCRARQLSIAKESEQDELATALNVARREITVLRKQLRAQEADAFVERGMRLGKISDATSLDWRSDYLRDAHHAEARLARAPISFPPGRVTSREHTPTQTVARTNPWGVDTADLDAFDRALAAGRVRITT